MTELPALAKVCDFTLDYWQSDGWVNAVNGVSFAVRTGETLGLVGESGSGKSTVAHAMIGHRHVASRVRSGKILFQGSDLFTLAPPALQRLRGRSISFVPQNPTTALSPGMRIGDQLGEALAVHGIGGSRAERRARVLALLDQVRLPDSLRSAAKYPHQLSGGQQQRVVIAMALACDPRLLILDEPTTGLDVTTQAQILELLKTLRAERGMAMVYVTHNMAVVANVCDRIGVMYAGELVEEGAAAEIFRAPRHPYTRGLIASVPSVTNPSRGRSELLHGILDRSRMPSGCRFAPRCDFAEAACFASRQVLAEVAARQRVACQRWRVVGAEAAAAPNRMIEARGDAVVAPEPLLEVTDLSCAYRGEGSLWLGARLRTVVHGLSLEIRPAETYALVGESGSGKSTVARAIAGLVPPVGGHITFAGQDIAGSVNLRDPRLRKNIQLILQNPDASLNPRQRVRWIIGRPLELFFRLRGAALHARVERLLQDVRLDSAYAERFPDQLSGGERQRVAIARALAAEPRLLLCDEILSALDVSVQAEVLDLLRDLQARRGIAYLFISHDLAVVRSLAQRVGVLYRGNLVEIGAVEEVFEPPFHPYSEMLLAAVPEVRTEPGRAAVVPRATLPPIPSHAAGGCPFIERCPRRLGLICAELPPPWRVVSRTHALRCHLPLTDLQDIHPMLRSRIDEDQRNHG